MKTNSLTRSRFISGLALLALVSLTGCQSMCGVKAPKKVLVVTATYGFPHSSVTVAEKVLIKLGEESHAFTVADVIRSGPRPADKTAEAAWDAKVRGEMAEKMSPEGLKKYDAVIFANTTGMLPVPDPDAFIAWVKSGKGLVGMHSASDTFHEPLKKEIYQPYIDMLGGEFLTHGPQVKVQCINQDPKHPATKDLGPIYEVTDEIYQFQNFHRDQVHGLLGLDKHPNNGTPGDYPVAWCKQVGKGKIFYTSLGHREDVWESATYQKHILGGIKWALGLEKGDSKPQTKK